MIAFGYPTKHNLKNIALKFLLSNFTFFRLNYLIIVFQGDVTIAGVGILPCAGSKIQLWRFVGAFGGWWMLAQEPCNGKGYLDVKPKENVAKTLLIISHCTGKSKAL